MDGEEDGHDKTEGGEDVSYDCVSWHILYSFLQSYEKESERANNLVQILLHSPSPDPQDGIPGAHEVYVMKGRKTLEVGK